MIDIIYLLVTGLSTISGIILYMGMELGLGTGGVFMPHAPTHENAELGMMNDEQVGGLKRRKQ